MAKLMRDAQDTSREAAFMVEPREGTQRKRVLDTITDGNVYEDADGHRFRGLCDEEIMTRTGIKGNSVHPRRLELVEGGWIVDSGVRIKLASGCHAIVWTPTAKGRVAAGS